MYRLPETSGVVDSIVTRLALNRKNSFLGFKPSMEKQTPQPVCGQEALDLLNCVTESPFDQEKCLRFLQSLRECVLSKNVKKFSIPSQDHDNESAAVSPLKKSS